MKALIAALYMMIAPVQISECYIVAQEQKFIEEHRLEKVYLSCYLPTGNKTADGTVPYEGIVSSNKEHLGMDCILYDADLVPYARFECRDIGGNSMLRAGTAIDVYRDDMDRAWQFIGDHGTWAYIEWIPREEGKEDEESIEARYEAD